MQSSGANSSGVIIFVDKQAKKLVRYDSTTHIRIIKSQRYKTTVDS